MIVDCQYKLICGDGNPMGECASNFNEEQSDAISKAFETINVSIEVDDAWGFCKIVAINGVSINGYFE